MSEAQRTLAPVRPVVSGQAPRRRPLPPLVVALRPKQYAKNLIVFAPAMFALRFDQRTLLLSGLAFVTFCAVSSATYLVNDSMDAEADRAHPVKRSRPVAAGLLSVRTALLAAALGAGLSLAAGFAFAPGLGVALVAYLAVQAAYNLRLKREPILDVMCVALGFVVRALGAGAATGIQLSSWFLLCVALLALYLGIEKRKSELGAPGADGATRAVLKSYTLAWLRRMETVVAASALMSYSLWAAQRTPDHLMLATVPMVAYVLFRYQMISETPSAEAPEVVMLHSPHIVAAGGLWAAVGLAILLLHSHGAVLPICGAGC
jgi:4-hydroxybenzoate polyprenyltransferase